MVGLFRGTRQNVRLIWTNRPDDQNNIFLLFWVVLFSVTYQEIGLGIRKTTFYVWVLFWCLWWNLF